MDISKLRKSTEKIVVMLDLYDRVTSKENEDSLTLSANKYKINFIKDKMMLDVLENKRLCEKMIYSLKEELLK